MGVNMHAIVGVALLDAAPVENTPYISQQLDIEYSPLRMKRNRFWVDVLGAAVLGTLPDYCAAVLNPVLDDAPDGLAVKGCRFGILIAIRPAFTVDNLRDLGQTMLPRSVDTQDSIGSIIVAMPHEAIFRRLLVSGAGHPGTISTQPHTLGTGLEIAGVLVTDRAKWRPADGDTLRLAVNNACRGAARYVFGIRLILLCPDLQDHPPLRGG
ncbi:MAG: hypothetical protein IT323_21350 [Anaerolineae bacterium]|nr:hypothetical protein [Anaerolineae bacterium]